MKVVNQVNQTNDYAMFKTLQGNRNVNKLHVERLKNSFKDKYLLSPILVNQNYEIIDGQHRYNAAKQLNLPINFIIVNDYGLKEVQLLNTNMSNWKKEDYLHAFCDLGYPEYLKMRKFMREFPDLGIMASEQILTNYVGGTNNRDAILEIDGEKVKTKTLKGFQEGDLYIENEKQAYENAEKIMMFKPFYKGFNRAVFVATMISLLKHQNYNHSQMISKVASNPTSLVDCSNVTQYKILLEEIYNFRSREKVSLRF